MTPRRAPAAAEAVSPTHGTTGKVIRGRFSGYIRTQFPRDDKLTPPCNDPEYPPYLRMKARNGAMPVPMPIIRTAALRFSGSGNARPKGPLNSMLFPRRRPHR